jgi:predicted amidohydrolase YtcJ
VIGYGDNHLTVRAIKRSIDGALGARGAWLLEPYSDLPESRGLNTDPVADVEATAAWAIENDFQFCVHAIGDRANRETLDIFEKTFAAHPDKRDLRWRDEHTQHLHPDDIPRFAELGVIASMQGIHCTSDAPYVIARLGERRAEEGAYVWKSLLDTGTVISNGTDAPVEDVDPIASYYATVSRRLKDGSVFYPQQRLSRLEALKSYTLSAAYAAFEEDLKGSLTVGKLADVTVLSQNILTVAEDDLPSTEVVHTIVGGKVIYSRDDRSAHR